MPIPEDILTTELNTTQLDLISKLGNMLYSIRGAKKFTTFADSMKGIDSVRNSIYMPEFESHGYTFITRPKLNLTSSSLRQDRILTLLDEKDDVNSIAFAVRALLDTNLTKRYTINNLSNSALYDDLNPFIPILTNRLLTLNGWPDPTLDVETSEGGFFSESITYPKGYDQLTRNYDLSSSFADIQGSVVTMLFTMWIRFISLLTRGIVLPYVEDIEARRMCFTSSIYRFVMDPSNRYIIKWAKATGCFPRSVPLGAFFNYDSNTPNVDISSNLAVPFSVAGKVEYYDPIILREFNIVTERRCSEITGYKRVPDSSVRMMLNYKCIPYIDLTTNELMWMYNPADKTISDILGSVKSGVEELADEAKQLVDQNTPVYV